MTVSVKLDKNLEPLFVTLCKATGSQAIASRSKTMGAWGHGNFDNDDAMDFVGDLEASGAAAIDAALSRVPQEGEYFEAPDASAALAACEVVAGLRGRPALDLPDEVRAWLAGQSAPNPGTLSKARSVCSAVLADSELKELWEESGESARWQANVADLRRRLG